MERRGDKRREERIVLVFVMVGLPLAFSVFVALQMRTALMGA